MRLGHFFDQQDEKTPKQSIVRIAQGREFVLFEFKAENS